MGRPIRIIDKRNKQYFVVDDAYLNGYARYLGPITSMVYIALCRHVDKNQFAFPSQKMIAEKLGIGLRSVENSIGILKKWGLIDIQRDKTERRWTRNSYYLLDKSTWKHLSPAPHAVDGSPAPDDNDHPHQVRTKDTHKKDTHTLSISKFSKVDDLQEKDLIEIATKYQVPVSFVRSKYDDMMLWAGERPGNVKVKGRNWKLTLMKWVKTDSMKIRKEEMYGKPEKRGIDASNL